MSSSFEEVEQSEETMISNLLDIFEEEEEKRPEVPINTPNEKILDPITRAIAARDKFNAPVKYVAIGMMSDKYPTYIDLIKSSGFSSNFSSVKTLILSSFPGLKLWEGLLIWIVHAPHDQIRPNLFTQSLYPLTPSEVSFFANLASVHADIIPGNIPLESNDLVIADSIRDSALRYLRLDTSSDMPHLNTLVLATQNITKEAELPFSTPSYNVQMQVDIDYPLMETMSIPELFDLIMLSPKKIIVAQARYQCQTGSTSSENSVARVFGSNPVEDDVKCSVRMVTKTIRKEISQRRRLLEYLENDIRNAFTDRDVLTLVSLNENNSSDKFSIIHLSLPHARVLRMSVTDIEDGRSDKDIEKDVRFVFSNFARNIRSESPSIHTKIKRREYFIAETNVDHEVFQRYTFE